jgi:hypothetical protein
MDILKRELWLYLIYKHSLLMQQLKRQDVNSVGFFFVPAIFVMLCYLPMG